MRLGPPLALLLIAAAALAIAGHAGAQVFCSAPYACGITLPKGEDLTQDVWVNEAAPDQNYNEGDGSHQLVVRAGEGQQAWTIVRFPIDLIPRNITIRGVSMVFNAQSITLGRTLHIAEAQAPWDEDTLTWNSARNLTFGPPIYNVSLDGTSQPLFTFGGTFVFGSGDCDCDLTQAFRKYYARQEPYYGLRIRDNDPTTADLPQSQTYNSSSDANADGHRPYLFVSYDPNTPELYELLVDNRTQVNASSTRPVNLSFLVLDRLGSVVSAFINVTDEFGQEKFNRSVFQNRTTTFLDFNRYRVWSNESLNLTPGRYIMNAFAIDDDGNLNNTVYKLINITVENNLPNVTEASVTDAAGNALSDLDEGELIKARVNATDAESGIATVTLEVKRGAEVVANLSLNPQRVDGNKSGDWNLTVAASFAGFLNLTLWVQDTAGNFNHSGLFTVHVRDRFPPVIGAALVRTPLQGPDGNVQEEGGQVRWEVHATDASPLSMSLEVSPPSGQPFTVPMQRFGLTDLYTYVSNFSARGSYGAKAIARDPDGNLATREGLGFFIRAAQPPDITELAPEPEKFSVGQPPISALLSDFNLDPTSVTLEVRTVPGDFQPSEAQTATVTDTSRRVSLSQPESFFHGERVEVRVRARDLLGNAAEKTWAFTVDARPPVSFLTPEGTFLAGNVTLMTGNTTLKLDRSDEGSGMLATVLGVTNDDHRLAAENITLPGNAPATLNLSGSPVFRGTGNYSVFVSSVDVAGNVEAVQRLRFIVDDTAPNVTVDFEPGLLTARVREVGAGVREVRAQYWLTPSGQQGSVLLSPSPGGATWQGQIPDGERGSRAQYALTATDLLGNVGRAGTESNPLSSIIQNHKPRIVVNPPNGSLVRGPVTVEWAVTDRDNDPVQVSVAVRPSTSDTARDLAPDRGPTGTTTWDTAREGDGLWAVRVTARDGYDTVVQEAFIDVANTDSKIAGFTLRAGEPGEAVTFEATIYRPVRQAFAVVARGAQELARINLTDDGIAPDRKARDGVFSGQYTPTATGDYRVDLDVAFMDGRSEHREAAGVAHVQWAFPGVLVREPLLLLVVVLAPAVLVAGVLYRRYGPIARKKR